MQPRAVPTRDDIHGLIAASAIYADLRRAPLTEPKRVLLYCTDEEAQSSGSTVSQPKGTDVHGCRNRKRRLG